MYQSFCLLVFILDTPKQGTHLPAYAYEMQSISNALHLGLIGISPPPGSLEGALLCCDGSRSALGRDASIIIPSAGHRRRWMCVPSSELGGQKVASAHVAAAPHGGRRKVKGALGIQLSKSKRGNKRKPSLSKPKSEDFERIIFQKFFGASAKDVFYGH